MRLPEHGFPTPMSRVALVAPETRLRALLVVVAEFSCAQFVGPLPAPQGAAVEALRRLERAEPRAEPARPGLAESIADVAQLERAGRRDLLAGEVELSRHADAAVRHGRFAALVVWVPSADLPALTERLATVGAAAVELPRPLLVDPPTLLRPGRLAGAFQPLVDTYGAARYRDVDPTPFAAASFVLMFGMMFGDAGQGLLLAALGLLLRQSRSARLQRIRPLWPFAVAGGLVAAVFRRRGPPRGAGRSRGQPCFSAGLRSLGGQPPRWLRRRASGGHPRARAGRNRSGGLPVLLQPWPLLAALPARPHGRS
jgi:V/A-type H+-transporting ATPase subunit I